MHHYPESLSARWPAGLVYWSVLGHFRRISHLDGQKSERVVPTWHGRTDG